ncbi:reverse transcriptase domain, reverse transcriptase zinc-binding domain protein [Tanacetum coccineum]
MKWELEAETRMLEDNEVETWLEERRVWIEKDRKRADMLKQKIRVAWDVEGDENSKFFHSMIKRRNKKSNICALMVEDIWCEDPGNIKKEVYRFYKSIFMEQINTRPSFANERVKKLSDKDVRFLEMQFGEKEIWEAISYCCGEKAHGPDGFNFKFIKRSASTSILVNRSPTYEFCLERDIRQGDPLSPFLFIITAKGLNAMVREAISKGLFKGISAGDDNVVVSHLQYANDTIFFGEWNVENARVLMCILKCFKEVSGLKVNLNKSLVYGVGVPKNEIEGMARWMGCCVGEFPFTYLGLPIGSNMRRVSAWRLVMEKVKKRLSEWRAKSMSFGFVCPRVGNRWDTYFWVDRFSRLYHLDSRKEAKVAGNELRGHGGGSGSGDSWTWLLEDNGRFTVKALSKMVDNKLPVRSELDKSGIDLDSLLCPSCNDVVETIDHCLVLCNMASHIWEKIFDWWKIALVNAFSTNECVTPRGYMLVGIKFECGYNMWFAVFVWALLK